MAHSNNSTTCMMACWVIAFIVGMIVVYVTAGSMPYVVPLFLGLIAALIVGLLLLKVLCKGAAQATPIVAKPTVAATSTPAQAEADTEAQAAAASEAAAAQQAEDAAAEAAKAAQAAMAAETAVSTETADGPAAEGAANQVVAPLAAQPVGLSAARDSGADDLKQIKGVGPKLEQLLNSLGQFHFDQIAGWSASDVAWMDDNLQGFKGRVSRDGWVEQAKILATGEATEFSKRVEDGGVY